MVPKIEDKLESQMGTEPQYYLPTDLMDIIYRRVYRVYFQKKSKIDKQNGNHTYFVILVMKIAIFYKTKSDAVS